MHMQQRTGRSRPKIMLAIGLTLLVIASSASLTPRLAVPTRAGGAGACASPAPPQGALNADPTYVKISFANQCGQPEQLGVDIAADIATQERGLMNVQTLPADQGELFDMANVAAGNEVQESFWMEDTLIPLSIAFIGKDETVHEVQDMDAGSTALHTPSQPYLYAVEANLGWFANHQVVAGSKADLASALALVGRSTNP